MLQMYGILRSLLYRLYDGNGYEEYDATTTTRHAKHEEHDDEYDVQNYDDVSRLLYYVYGLCYVHVKG